MMNDSSDPKPESYPMNGGDGSFSYNKNSHFQRIAVIAANDIINEGIAKILDVTKLSPTLTAFNITDLGCSIGPNTFFAVQNIIDVVRKKYEESSRTRPVPDFQVFFNDHVSNDFNTLFASLPSSPDRQYYAAGVPGSYHTRLFPDSSLHLALSNNSVHWLSKVPDAVVDSNSPAWNKGRVHYTSAPSEVGEAYLMQFIKDMGVFLNARSREIVRGGLMVLIMSGVPEGEPHSQYKTGVIYDLLGFCLMDMVMEGKISEDKVNSFNFPIYAPCPSDMRKVVEANGCFSIELLELNFPGMQFSMEARTKHIRAGAEALISSHFGSEIIDELFDRFLKKAQENVSLVNSKAPKGSQLILILKRK